MSEPIAKCCGRCRMAKGLELFSPDRRTKTGRHAYCKECRAEKNLERYHEKKREKEKQNGCAVALSS